MQENISAAPKERAGLSLLRLDHWRVGHRLIALVVAIALPLNLLIIAVIASLASSSIELQRTSILYTTRSVASGVDAQLAKYMAIAADLQRSPALMADDLAAFEAEARQALTAVPDAWIVVADAAAHSWSTDRRRPGGPCRAATRKHCRPRSVCSGLGTLPSPTSGAVQRSMIGLHRWKRPFSRMASRFEPCP